MVELDTLLSAQWANGMIPHIVFANGVDGYFPGPALGVLGAGRPRAAAPAHLGYHPAAGTRHRGARILDRARTRGRSTRAVAEAFLDRRWPDLVRWHRWLAEGRDQQGMAGSRCTTGGSPAWTTRHAGMPRTPT